MLLFTLRFSVHDIRIVINYAFCKLLAVHFVVIVFHFSLILGLVNLAFAL